MGTPTITIGGKPADIQFSGLAPCFVGLWQLNVKVPEDAPTGGDVPMVITLNDQTGSTTTIAVK